MAKKATPETKLAIPLLTTPAKVRRDVLKSQQHMQAKGLQARYASFKLMIGFSTNLVNYST